MPDVRALLEDDRDTGEYVQRAILLNVAAVLDDNSAPVPTDGSARPDIHVAPDNDVSGNRRIRMDEGRFVDDGNESVE